MKTTVERTGRETAWLSLQLATVAMRRLLGAKLRVDGLEENHRSLVPGCSLDPAQTGGCFVHRMVLVIAQTVVQRPLILCL